MAKTKLKIESVTAEVNEHPTQQTAGLRKFNKAEEQVGKAVKALQEITSVSCQDQLEIAMAQMKAAKAVEKVIEEKRTELVKPHNDEVKRINAYAKELTGKIPPAVEAVKKLVLTFHQEEERKQKLLRTEARVAQLVAIGFVAVCDTSKQVDSFVYGTSVTIQMFSIENEDDALWNLRITRTEADIHRLKEVLLKAKETELEEIDFFGSEQDKTAVREQINKLQSAPVQGVDIPTGQYSPAKPKGLTKRWAYEVTDLAQVPRGFLQLDEKAVKEAIASGVRQIAGIRIFQDESITIR
ncbi:hypothetical protein [Chitinophaga sp. YIM B06452]|uniref:hypothetical protein n=1 Tax=Chitinophaga sp. YIM B06452 TaxID=3082158 RepID=UPI0031FE4AE2